MKLIHGLYRLGRGPVSPTRYILNLLGFLLLSFFLIGGGVMFRMDWNAVSGNTAPAPSPVAIPSDLPFPVAEVSFEGTGGIRLAGWYVPPRNGVVIILLHGYSGNRLGMRWHAERLVAAGYGVLLYDERASGESGGRQRSMGWLDVEDVNGALALLAAQGNGRTNRIGFLGCSMGAEIGLTAAARHPQIEAVIADGPGVVTAEDQVLPATWVNPIFYLSDRLYDRILSFQTGLPIPPPIIHTIGKIAPRPILLIAGGVEWPLVGSEEPRLRRYARYAGSNATVWVIPEALHCDGPAVRPEEYALRMIGFFDNSFGVSRPAAAQ
jgi:pimeloyl-ACP methyl ester carboxylesterase